MNANDVLQKLNAVADSDDFIQRASELTEKWSAQEDSEKAIEPILLFLETHPDLDVGSPGPLVHFVEKFFRRGYEAKLLESLRRKPTAHTVWMLNRIINGVKVADQKQQYINAMSEAGKHPLADPLTREEASNFLQGIQDDE